MLRNNVRRCEKSVEIENYKTWKSSFCKWVYVCRFSLPCQGVWGLSVPYVTVFGAVSPGPRGRSAEQQAIHCAVLHDILWVLQFVK